MLGAAADISLLGAVSVPVDKVADASGFGVEDNVDWPVLLCEVAEAIEAEEDD